MCLCVQFMKRVSDSVEFAVKFFHDVEGAPAALLLACMTLHNRDFAWLICPQNAVQAHGAVRALPGNVHTVSTCHLMCPQVLEQVMSTYLAAWVHLHAASNCFAPSAVFNRELELYANPALEGILPKVYCISANQDGAAKTSWSYVFPPYIIVERGESLNEWCSRVSPNFATTLFVLLHVAERLQQLHASGLCHRDLKCVSSCASKSTAHSERTPLLYVLSDR